MGNVLPKAASFISFLFLALGAFPAVSEGDPSLLFVYDTLDEKSDFYITHLREQLRESGFAFEEAAVKNETTVDVGQYDTIVVYSRVMAFNMSSPVRAWLKSVKTFEHARVYIFVTAARWFEQKHKEELLKIVSRKNPEEVDAVTSATEKMTDRQKIDGIKEFVKMFSE